MIFHLLDEPVPTLADPFPVDDPLPGAYELQLPAEGVTSWYAVATYEGQASSTSESTPDYIGCTERATVIETA